MTGAEQAHQVTVTHDQHQPMSHRQVAEQDDDPDTPELVKIVALNQPNQPPLIVPFLNVEPIGPTPPAELLQNEKSRPDITDRVETTPE